MEDYKNYLGKYYLDSSQSYIILYEIVGNKFGYGAKCGEINDFNHGKVNVYIYDDLPESYEDDVLFTVIPGFDKECGSEEISKEQFEELKTTIEEFKELLTTVQKDCKKFMNKVWTGQRNIKK